MRYVILIVILLLTGCSGVGLEKQATVVPDSVSVGYVQERYRGDTCGWRGMSISATWEFK